MEDETRIHDNYPNDPVDNKAAKETVGVKIYERPARRTVPMWLWLGLMVLVLILTWIAINAIG